MAGLDSSGGTVTGKRLDPSGTDAHWGTFFRAVQTGTSESTQPPVQCILFFFLGLERPEHSANQPRLSSAGLRMHWSYHTAVPLRLDKRLTG